jgi:hypothetical protein
MTIHSGLAFFVPKDEGLTLGQHISLRPHPHGSSVI